jgi:anion-transporting  ArsA/GET3 family ATPase
MDSAPGAPGPGPAGNPLDRRLLFVTGKGGVGKSTVAAGLALLAADLGKKVLLVDVDGKGSPADYFERPRPGFKPEEFAPGVFGITMDTEASLQEYLKLNLRVPVFGRLGPAARIFDFVATAAPGVREILTVGKVCWEVRESIAGRADWDIVIVDAPASGHVIAQLDAPRIMQEFVQVGPVRAQTQWMAEILADPSLTALHIVVTPEEMPVAETIELVDTVRRDLEIHLGTVIVNRVLPELFTLDDEVVFDALREPAGAEPLIAACGPGATAVLEGARLAVSLRRTRAVHLNRLRASLDAPLAYLPYLFVRSHGRRVTRMVADALGEELL